MIENVLYFVCGGRAGGGEFVDDDGGGGVGEFQRFAEG